MDPKRKRLLSSLLITFGGVVALTLLLLFPKSAPKKHIALPQEFPLLTAPVPEFKPSQLKPPVVHTTLREGLTGALFQKIPSYFPIAFSINVSSFNTFFWAHTLFSLNSQPSLKRKLDSLGVSLHGIKAVGAGLLPRHGTVRWRHSRLLLSMPPLTFLFKGREGRMAALRRYWKKRDKKGFFFRQGDFQLGFPMGANPHYFLGTYKTSLKPVMQLVENPKAAFDLCTAASCRTKIQRLGLIPDAVLLYHPSTPLRIRSSLSLSSLILALELNPDGVLLRALLETSLSCAAAETALRKFLQRALLRIKLQHTFLKRAFTRCPRSKTLFVTLSLASSEVKTQIVQLGLLPK